MFTVLITSRLTPGLVQIDRAPPTAAAACDLARAEHQRTGAAVRVLADGEELLAIPESADEDDWLEADAEGLAWLDAHACQPLPATLESEAA